jgi:hypothetical protein
MNVTYLDFHFALQESRLTLAPKPRLVHHLLVQALPSQTARMEGRRIRSDQGYLLMAKVEPQILDVDLVRLYRCDLHQVQKNFAQAPSRTWTCCAHSGLQLAAQVIWASARVSHPVQLDQKGARVVATHDLVSSKSSAIVLAQVEVWPGLGCLWLVESRQYLLSALSMNLLGCQAARDSKYSASRALLKGRGFRS